MNIKYLVVTLLFFAQNAYSQGIKDKIKFGEVDSNYEKIIYETYWAFDTVATKKMFGYQFKPWTKGVVYDFNPTSTKMCYSEKQQEIPTTWVTIETEIALITFEVKEESTRWLVIYVNDNNIIFQNWVPDSPYPYIYYKPTYYYFVFRRVENFGCQ